MPDQATLEASLQAARRLIEPAPLKEARRLIEPTPMSSVISDQSCVCIRVEVLRWLIQVVEVLRWLIQVAEGSQ
jgi:hypothetical protein